MDSNKMLPVSYDLILTGSWKSRPFWCVWMKQLPSCGNTHAGEERNNELHHPIEKTLVNYSVPNV